ncbi:MAG TPA: hypothetical protein VFL93_03960 [Longimicrobiaceae bacterium]|nr:hypothetical protein [Longimicrobiaceae bacterium]
MKRLRTLAVVLPLLLVSARAAHAQKEAAPLGRFVQTLARLWADGDADGLIAYAPPDGLLLLDTGDGSESVTARHAAAALRALFSSRETVDLRQVRVTVAGGSPLRGFGEIRWTFRVRDMPAVQTRSIYLGLVWTGRSWRLGEIRFMP